MASEEITKYKTKFLDNIKLIHKPISSLGIKYPTLRDNHLHTGYLWLKGRQADDGAEGLWRIHDGLYNLKDFVRLHPGGADWLRLTEGTDITEAFECHHINEFPRTVMKKYYVREATTLRNFPFTFKEDGFYNILKGRIREELKNIPEAAATKSKYITDLLLFGYIFTALLATYFSSLIVGIVSGVLLGLTAIAAHNYFHQKDNFRMYYFDLTMMDYREWRISHALSHHLYTNTINDLEISNLEPWLQYLPVEKFFFFKYLSWFYSPIFYSLVFVGHFIKTIIQTMIVGKGIEMGHIIPFMVPAILYLATGQTILTCILFYLWIQFVGSLYFGLIGLNAGHHHPDVFHDGDAVRPKEEIDWGIFQVDAVMDRKDITGSHFLVLTSFGDHALHHMFPTIDHGKLQYLYPVFLKTCEEFGVKWKLSSQLEVIKGQFRQLSKTKPSSNPPPPLKKF